MSVDYFHLSDDLVAEMQPILDDAEAAHADGDTSDSYHAPMYVVSQAIANGERFPGGVNICVPSDVSAVLQGEIAYRLEQMEMRA